MYMYLKKKIVGILNKGVEHNGVQPATCTVVATVI